MDTGYPSTTPGPTLATSDETNVVHEPTVTTNVHNEAHGVIPSAPIGSSVHDKADVVGEAGGPVPTGTVSFELFSAASCNGEGVTGVPVPLAPVNLTTASAESLPTTVPIAGLAYKAHYSGDGNYTPKDGVCESLEATKLAPEAVTEIHTTGEAVVSAPVVVGTGVHDKATVTGGFGTPTGSVDFYFYVGSGCLAEQTPAAENVPLVAGVAHPSPTHTPVTPGSYSFLAHYNGDSVYTPIDAQCEPLTVTKADTVIETRVHNANHENITTFMQDFGTAIHDNATVTGGPTIPSGNVTFTLHSNSSCDGGTIATEIVALDLLTGIAESPMHNDLPVGDYGYSVSYPGDDTHNGSSEQCEPFHIQKLTPTVTTTIHDAQHVATTTVPAGTIVHDSAHVAGTGPMPTGNVSFLFFSAAECPVGTGVDDGTVGLDGSGDAHPSLSSGSLTTGSYSYQATYSGDEHYSLKVGPCEPLTVVKRGSVIETQIHKVVIDQDVVVTTTPAGSTVHDKATVTGGDGTPTGFVDFLFFHNGTCAPTGDPAGHVALNGSGVADPSNSEGPLAPGEYSFLANYGGDNVYDPAVAQCEHLTVAAWTPTISTQLSATEIPVGGSIHDSATLTSASPDAGGNVTYTIFPNSSCTTGGVAAGVAAVTAGIVGDSNVMPFNSAGTFYWQAVYSGDTNNTTVTSDCTKEVVTVNMATTGIVTTPLPASGPIGTVLKDSSVLSGGVNPTGLITFNLYNPVDITCVAPVYTETVPVTGVNGAYGTLLAGYTSLVAGTYHWGASYSGDLNNSAASSPCSAEPVVIGQNQPSVATTLSSLVPVVTGTAVHDSAVLSGVTTDAGGTVTYNVYTDAACSILAGTQPAGNPVSVANGIVPISGDASFATAGTYYWQAVYSGDGNNAGPVSSPCQSEVLTVNEPQTETGSISGFKWKDIKEKNDCKEDDHEHDDGHGHRIHGYSNIHTNHHYNNKDDCDDDDHQSSDGAGNGVFDPGESKLPGWTVFIDANANKILDLGETSTVTDGSGNYSFTGLLAGTYSICEVMQNGWAQTYPGTGAGTCHSVVLGVGANVGDKNFGNSIVASHECKQGDHGDDHHGDDNHGGGGGGNTDDHHGSVRGWQWTPVPPPSGTIVIKKVTVGGDGTFTFDPTYGLPFQLSNGDSKTTGHIEPGNYMVHENSTEGWTQTSAVCVSSKGDTETVGNLSLQANETITCTFTNTKDPEKPKKDDHHDNHGWNNWGNNNHH